MSGAPVCRLDNVPVEAMTLWLVPYIVREDRRNFSYVGKRYAEAVALAEHKRLRIGVWGAWALSPPIPNSLFEYFEACTFSYATDTRDTTEPYLRYRMGRFSIPVERFLVNTYTEGSDRLREPREAYGALSDALATSTDLRRFEFAFFASPWDLGTLTLDFVARNSDLFFNLFEALFSEVPVPLEIPEDQLDSKAAILERLLCWEAVLSRLRTAFAPLRSSRSSHLPLVLREKFPEGNHFYFITMCMFLRRVMTFIDALDLCPASEAPAVFSAIATELNIMALGWNLAAGTVDHMKMHVVGDHHKEVEFETTITRLFNRPRKLDPFGVTCWSHDQRALFVWITKAFGEETGEKIFALHEKQLVLFNDSLAPLLGEFAASLAGELKNAQIRKYFKDHNYVNVIYFWTNILRPEIGVTANRTWTSYEQTEDAVERIQSYLMHFNVNWSQTLSDLWDPRYVAEAQRAGAIPYLTLRDAIIFAHIFTEAPVYRFDQPEKKNSLVMERIAFEYIFPGGRTLGNRSPVDKIRRLAFYETDMQYCYKANPQ